MVVLHSMLLMLLYKNMKMEIRLWRRFMCELFFIMFVLVILVANPKMRGQHYRLNLRDNEATIFLSESSFRDLDLFKRSMNLNKVNYKMTFAPDNEFTSYIMGYVSRKLNIEYSIGYATEKEMEENFDPSYMLAGVVFKNIDQSVDDDGVYNGTINGSNLTELSIAIRFPPKFRTVKQLSLQEQLWATRCSGVIDARNPHDFFKQRNIYLSEGFVQIQNEIFRAWLNYLVFYKYTDKDFDDFDDETKEETDETEEEDDDVGQEQKLTGRIEEFDNTTRVFTMNDTERQYIKYVVFLKPYRPRYTHSTCPYYNITKLYTFLYTFTFLLPFCNLIWKMAREREDNILVSHWNFGCEYKVHWIAHFVTAFVHFLIINLLILIILKVPFISTSTAGTFVHSNAWLLLTFLLFHSMALIVSAIFVVVLIVNAWNAVLFGIIFWVFNYGLLFSLLYYDRNSPMSHVYGSIAFFFGNSFAYILHLLKFHTYNQIQRFWLTILTLFVNICMYTLLIVVVQIFNPGRYISRRSFGILDFFGLSTPKINTAEFQTISSDYFEGPPVNAVSLVRLRNVTTFYDDGPNKDTIQLQNLSLNIYDNEITVILGHHGAGKTTLIRTLAGWRRPEFGDVYYMDRDLYENWWKLTKYSDVLMPNNPLFDYLTVRETLMYFVRLKSSGLRDDSINVEVNKWVEKLKVMIENADVHANRLTFDQKRLLCLCCVLAFDTPIVLLDEPTLHLQFETKKYFWTILNDEKKHRAIVLTTFCYDEAQTIGDRIAILSEGVVIFHGTTFFLELNHGTYNDLYILKSDEASTEEISNTIRTVMSSIKLEYEINNQLLYRIPNKYRSRYQLLLIKLETNSEDLGIQRLHMLSPSVTEYYLNIEIGCRKNPGFQIIPTEKKWQTTEHVAKKYLWGNRFSACFFEKILQQQGRTAPVCTLTLILILISLVNSMFHVYKVENERGYSIKLGMPHNVGAKNFTKITSGNCDYIEVPKLFNHDAFRGMYATNRMVDIQTIECSVGESHEYITNPKSYIQTGIIEIDFDPEVYFFRCILWANQRPFHSVPLALNILHNLLLHYIYPEKPELKIIVQNSPFRMSVKQEMELLHVHIPFISLSLAIGSFFPMVMATFIMPIVWIRNSNVYTILKICGLSDATYWLVTFIWDFLYVLVYSFIFIIVLTISDMTGLSLLHKLYIFFLILAYFLTSLSMIYLVSIFKHKSEFRAALVMTLVLLFFGIFNFILYLEVSEQSKIIYLMLSFIPPFAVLDGVRQVFLMRREYEICENHCNMTEECTMDSVCYFIDDCCDVDVPRWDGILKPFVFTIISTFLAVNVMIWTTVRREQLKYQEPDDIKMYHSIFYSFDNPKVVALRKFIASIGMAKCLGMQVCVDQLEEGLNRKSRRLNTVSFKINNSGCLCIYGSRHSGKTHLAKQLIGEIGIKFGEVYICGYDLRYRLKKIQKILGYCPQEYSLYEYSDIRAYFYLLYMLRGVPEEYIGAKIRNLGMMMNLTLCLKRKPYRLNAQLKRKVCFAAALIGYNQVLVLDEPTRGMSASVKREIWSVVRFLRSVGVTIIVLTSDTLECKMLADNVLLFDHYNVLAYDNIIRLRDAHSLGFVLHIKLRYDGGSTEECAKNLKKSIANCNRYVNFLSSEAILIMQRDQYLKFDIPCEKIHLKYSYLYGSLDKNKERLAIAQYRVSRITIQQILYDLIVQRKECLIEHEKRRKLLQKYFIDSNF